jgi:type II secretion system protein L
MRIIGLDVGEHEVRVAVGERRLGTLRLVSVERLPLSSDAALARLAGRRPDVVLSALPAAAVTHRFLTMPFRDRRRLARTVPFELRGQLPVEPATATVAFEVVGAADGGATVLAAVARRPDLDAHVARLSAAGLPPARIDLAPLPVWNLLPDATGRLALLVADGARSALAVRHAGRPTGLRALAANARDAPALVAEVRWSLAGLGGTPDTIVLAGADATPALEAALAAAVGARVVRVSAAARLPIESGNLDACAIAAGLVVGAGKRSRSGIALAGLDASTTAGPRRAIALALLVVLAGGVDLALVRRDLVRRDAALVAAIHDEAVAALPDARIVAPRAQLEAAALAARQSRARRGATTGALDTLRDLSTRVPAGLRLDLDELVIDADGVRLHGRGDSFDTVDALRRALATAPGLADVTADETRTTVDGKRVEFRLHATHRPAGGTSS